MENHYQVSNSIGKLDISLIIAEYEDYSTCYFLKTVKKAFKEYSLFIDIILDYYIWTEATSNIKTKLGLNQEKFAFR